MEQSVELLETYDSYERLLIIAFSSIAGVYPGGDLVHALPKSVCLEFAARMICKELNEGLNSMPAQDQQRILKSRIEALHTIAKKVTHLCCHRQTHDPNIYLDFASLTTVLTRQALLLLARVPLLLPEKKGKVMQR
jgi:hypothetical protein